MNRRFVMERIEYGFFVTDNKRKMGMIGWNLVEIVENRMRE